MMRIDRRGLIAGVCALPAARLAAAAGPARPALIAGTYAREGGAGLVTLLPGAEGWRAGPAAPIPDASFGVYSRRFRRWYLLDEQSAGTVTAYDAGWAARGRQSTGGADPCHATLDAGETCLAIANYSSGSVALVPLDPRTGAPLPAQIVAHHGHGPDADRQKGPHAHWVGFSPDGAWLHAVDLGADAIFAHRYDAAARRLGPGRIAYQAPPGSGPRHLARHPHQPRAYLVSELANSVTELAVTPAGGFTAVARHSTLPAGFAGHSQAAHIRLDARARRLYVSNRGHDSIAVFAVDAAGGLRLVQHIASGGQWPRFFLLLEAQQAMLVANEHSGSLAVLRVAPDGGLADSGTRIALLGTVFLAPLAG
ncbi:lactonase family protein [Sphingomonas morindae]|uniref:Lactonase family protein n=1 Tax=Sphingomonas morindae TaxID=1541170 RepID=A0ABY4X6N5_9SPHN|nr:lactonase family protein [Sphingomonas morindae]USI72514.1 lactonase family protein [Sphingomonas morindae]